MNNASLRRLRRVAEGNLNETAVIGRAGEATSDGMGGWTAAMLSVLTLPCRRVSTLNQAEQRIAERLAVVRPWIVQLPAETDVCEADQLTIGDDVLEVVHVGRSSWEAVRRVLCREIE